MSSDGDTRRSRTAIPWLVVGLGCLQFGTLVGTLVYYDGVGSLETTIGLLTMGIGGVLAGTVVVCGLLLRRWGISPERYPRALGWYAGAIIGFNTLQLPLLLAFPGLTLEGAIRWLHYTYSTGAAFGAIVGLSEARAVERNRAAERATALAEATETRNRELDYLNALLRHEVLNNASVIQGYAELSLQESSGQVEDYQEKILQQSRKMTSVIQDVRTLMESFQNDPAFDEVNLSQILADEVADLRATFPSVQVETDIKADLRVPADDLIARVFGNIMSNAVEHNDSETPRVTVTAAEADGTVTVRIADNGPGISSAQRETLFDKEVHADHGLGLYLVDTLVERYHGTVELTETGPDGSVFTVELPAVTAVDSPHTSDDDTVPAEPSTVIEQPTEP